MHKSKYSIHQLENIIPVFPLVLNYNPVLPNENQLPLGNITNVSIASTYLTYLWIAEVFNDEAKKW